MQTALKQQIETASYYTGIASMAVALPHRAAIIGKVINSEFALVKTLTQVTEHAAYQGLMKRIVMPLGMGLSTWSAYSAYERIISQPQENHVADYFLLASATAGLLATGLVIAGGAIPVAGVLGMSSLACDVLGALAIPLTSNSDGRWGDAAFQLGTTLLFGFDESHYQSFGRRIKNFAVSRVTEQAISVKPPATVDRQHASSEEELAPKPQRDFIDELLSRMTIDFHSTNERIPEFVPSDNTGRFIMGCSVDVLKRTGLTFSPEHPKIAVLVQEYNIDGDIQIFHCRVMIFTNEGPKNFPLRIGVPLQNLSFDPGSTETH